MLSVQVPTTGASSPRTTPHRIAGLDGLSRAAYENDLGHLWKNFESKLLDLFVDIPPKSRVGVATAERDQIRWVSTPEELCTTLEKGVSTLLILSRYNSWSRIDISSETFFMACHLAEITPFFLHFVIGMGIKHSSKDEDFMSCYSTFTPENNGPASSLSGGEAQGNSLWGICYNVRHFERHGRDLKDPWSCRQSALHHSFFATPKQSIWVVIQPPEAFDATVDSRPHPMPFHLRYLHAALANWREYLDSFAQRINILNQKIATPYPYEKLKINFSRQQDLHNLRGKLHHAQSILTSTRNTLNVIAEHESAVAQKQSLSPAIHENFQRNLRNISREVDNYIETSHELLLMSDDLRSMYTNILTFHGQELQHDTSLKLVDLAQADAAGNRDMAA